MKNFRLFILVILLSINSYSITKNDDKLIGLNFNTQIMRSNIEKCNDYVKNVSIKYIDELEQSPIEDVNVYNAGTIMMEMVDKNLNNECITGLLNNSINILDKYIKIADSSNYGYAMSKRELAKAIMVKAGYENSSSKKADYDKADILIKEYLNEEILDPEDKIATPSYFASYSYIDGSKATKDIEKLALLEKAINIAKNGMKLNMSKYLKNMLNEPIGISYLEKADYYDKNSKEYKNEINNAIKYFKRGYIGGDALSGYNIAASYSLLNDTDNAKLYLKKLAKSKKLNDLMCFDGIANDKDLDNLRNNDKEWVQKFFDENCLR